MEEHNERNRFVKLLIIKNPFLTNRFEAGLALGNESSNYGK